MGMEICTFVSDVNDSIIPEWLKKMKEIGMDCEIHPDFSFFNHTEYVPFKLKLAYSENDLLSRQSYLTGFGFSIQPFSLVEQIKAFVPKQNVLDKLLRKDRSQPYFVNAEIDERLADCRYCLSFKWGTSDIFELRMATISAAIIAELTNGVCSFPADGIWYDRQILVEDFANDADAYESCFSDRDIKLYPFTSWKNKSQLK